MNSEHCSGRRWDAGDVGHDGPVAIGQGRRNLDGHLVESGEARGQRGAIYRGGYVVDSDGGENGYGVRLVDGDRRPGRSAG